MIDFKELIESFLREYNWNETIIPYVSFLILLIATILIVIIGVWLTRFILNNTAGKIMTKTKKKWNTLLVKHKFLNAVSLFIVIIILKIALPFLLEESEKTFSFFEKLVNIFIIYVFYKIISTILRAVEEVMSQSKLYESRPLGSYFQLIRIILIIIALVLGISIMISKSPVYLLTAFGALSAVLLLIFKDTILGFVASVQISANDMVRIGDWIEMPKFNADGNVLSINLDTVKIRNWDNTISTVPTYYFVTESFKNYRGMIESGARRIKRSIPISVNSVRFVDKEQREKFLTFELIKDFIIDKQKEIDQSNEKNNIDTSVLINGRRMTNIGVFRVYVQKYLENHPGIRQDKTILARLRDPDESGIPLEVYCFANSIGLVDYEGTQSDIFDHLFGAAEFFGLEIFQRPTGQDFKDSLQSE